MKMLLTALVFVSASAFAEGHDKAAAAPAADAHGKPAAAATTAATKVDCKDAKNAKNHECMKEKHDKK